MMVTGAACGWPFVRVRRQSDHVLENATALPDSLAGGEGRSLVLMEAPVVMVGSDVVEVERRLRAAGAGHRPIAGRLERPVSTVRGWLRAFARNAESVRSVFTGLLVQFDPLTGPLPVHPNALADAVEAVGACAVAARRRLGVVGAVSPWQLAAAVTGGFLLAAAAPSLLINTSRPLGGVV